MGKEKSGSAWRELLLAQHYFSLFPSSFLGQVVRAQRLRLDHHQCWPPTLWSMSLLSYFFVGGLTRWWSVWPLLRFASDPQDWMAFWPPFRRDSVQSCVRSLAFLFPPIPRPLRTSKTVLCGQRKGGKEKAQARASSDVGQRDCFSVLISIGPHDDATRAPSNRWDQPGFRQQSKRKK